MMEQPSENKPSARQMDKRMVWMPLQAGCLTMIVAGLALLVGYLVDSRLGTFPRWTLIVLIGSAPFTFGGVFWMVRRSLNRLRGEPDLDENVDQDKEESQ
jgi:F0F1-type ATP synthase assembly protein I